MSASEWEPRPDDDLVEPLFGGLRGTSEEPVPQPARAHRVRTLRRILTWVALGGLLAKLAQEALR